MPPRAGIGRWHCEHRSVEFKRFLEVTDNAVPEEFNIRPVLDSYGTQKTATIRNRLARHGRFYLHFTSVSAA